MEMLNGKNKDFKGEFSQKCYRRTILASKTNFHWTVLKIKNVLCVKNFKRNKEYFYSIKNLLWNENVPWMFKVLCGTIEPLFLSVVDQRCWSMNISDMAKSWSSNYEDNIIYTPLVMYDVFLQSFSVLKPRPSTIYWTHFTATPHLDIQSNTIE